MASTRTRRNNAAYYDQMPEPQSAMTVYRQRSQDDSVQPDTSQADVTGGRTPELKPRTIRVRGLPDWDRNELWFALNDFIQSKLGDNEYTPDMTFIPSCNPKEKLLDALLDFWIGLPKFLAALEGRSPKQVELKFYDVWITFDSEFYGFTQLYNVGRPSEVVAE